MTNEEFDLLVDGFAEAVRALHDEDVMVIGVVRTQSGRARVAFRGGNLAVLDDTLNSLGEEFRRLVVIKKPAGRS